MCIFKSYILILTIPYTLFQHSTKARPKETPKYCSLTCCPILKELLPGIPITLDKPFPQEFSSNSRHVDAGFTQVGVLNKE
jgi:hypothetical protein